jgi:hypothetical protein
MSEQEGTEANEIPQEIGRGSIELAPGLTIEVITLDTGQAVIIEDSMVDFLNWIQQGNTIDSSPLDQLGGKG